MLFTIFGGVALFHRARICVNCLKRKTDGEKNTVILNKPLKKEWQRNYRLGIYRNVAWDKKNEPCSGVNMRWWLRYFIMEHPQLNQWKNLLLHFLIHFVACAYLFTLCGQTQCELSELWGFMKRVKELTWLTSAKPRDQSLSSRGIRDLNEWGKMNLLCWK